MGVVNEVMATHSFHDLPQNERTYFSDLEVATDDASYVPDGHLGTWQCPSPPGGQFV